MTGAWIIIAYVAGCLIGWMIHGESIPERKPDQPAERNDDAQLDEAETDRFLADLGRVYCEDLAERIAEEVGSRISESEDGSGVFDYDLVYSTALHVLSEGDSRISDRKVELCGHIGYPFGEPPAMFCDLAAGHSKDQDHESLGYKHAAITENRKQVGLDISPFKE